MKAQIYNYSAWINITDPKTLFNEYKEKLINSGFGIEDVIEKYFEPHGYTALFLLIESHFAIHTFPEEGQSYIELSSCVKNPFDNFVKML
jgi:S-adenosylmethionine decarboxylase